MGVAPFSVEPSAAALVVVDLQNDFVRVGAPQEVPDARATLPHVAALIAACRAESIPVLYTRYTAGPNATHLAWFSPECGPETRSCWRGETRRYADREHALRGHDVVDEIAPADDEVVIDKYGYGSFENTPLDDVLRAMRVRQVWLVGTVTQICVEETAREGFRRGYEIVIASDAVSSFDPEMHAATLRNMSQKFALVCTTEALCAAAAGTSA
jgi:nicotinamidase-related amidase